jgi:hypothetical protein
MGGVGTNGYADCNACAFLNRRKLLKCWQMQPQAVAWTHVDHVQDRQDDVIAQVSAVISINASISSQVPDRRIEASHT